MMNDNFISRFKNAPFSLLALQGAQFRLKKGYPQFFNFGLRIKT